MTPSVALRALLSAVALVAGTPAVATAGGAGLDLSKAVIVLPAGGGNDAERLAAGVLQEEIARRTGQSWAIDAAWPVDGRPSVAITARPAPAARAAPPRGGPEMYRIARADRPGQVVIEVSAAGARAALFAVGRLLRQMHWGPGRAGLDGPLDITAAPRYPLRGHQLGYRHHSNTYDGWDEARYDQYVRELVLLGANAVENIPFQDTRPSPLMPLPRAEMTRRVSAICAKYGIAYWLWVPVDVELGDGKARQAMLDSFGALAATLPRLDAVFVPGGDPGDNPATAVTPFLEELAARLAARHPDARVWLSLQHFDAAEVDYVYAWIDRSRPAWLGGLVAGPGSYPVADMRRRLDPRYGVRDYPDIAHTVRSQHPVGWWDPAFNFTLGREPVNPRPTFYAGVHDRLAPFTDGFITYSDGVNDDFNKALWTLKAWDPSLDARAIAREYARLFFGAEAAETAAEGLMGLERNWEGPLASNTAVPETLELWESGPSRVPSLAGNWRWQMHLMRATYDAYTQRRLQYESQLEAEALDELARAPRVGAAEAMARARRVLDRAVSRNCCPAWRARIEDLCQSLFAAIRLQTSVARHAASGFERGAVLDFVDHPLNNRWWYEDQFAAVSRLPDEPSRLSRLSSLVAWTRPGPGSFYDDVGNLSASPRVRRPAGGAGVQPHFAWEGGPSRARLSTLTSLRWPPAIDYAGLDPSARYVVRLAVLRPGLAPQVRLRIDGQPARPRMAEAGGAPLEFEVPAGALEDGRLTLTFDEVDERDVNWRQHSRLAEAWLIRQ